MHPIGLSGIILGAIELSGILLSISLLYILAKRSGLTKKELNQTWKINKERIQIGHQKYEVIV